MSERMTEADRSHLRGIAVLKWREGGPGGEAALTECVDAVADEVQMWLAEKDAQIKALADALAQVRLMVPWVKDESTTTGQMIAHALRLSGRLP